MKDYIDLNPFWTISVHTGEVALVCVQTFVSGVRAVQSEYRMQLSTVVSAGERLCPFLHLLCWECRKTWVCSAENACVPSECVKKD